MEQYGQIEKTIGYEFRNQDLLQQAFIRRSYSQENGGENNEVLEFIGDKALDLAVIRVLIDTYGYMTKDKEWKELAISFDKKTKSILGIHAEGKLSSIKQQLVQKKTLAKCIDALGFHKYLIMGKGDIKTNAQEEESIKEDLFEAIIGAVAVDCNYDMDKITHVVESLLDFDSIFSGENDEAEDYVSLLQNWYQKMGYGLPSYSYEQDYYDDHVCIVHLDIKNGCDVYSYRAEGYGSSCARARMEAAKNAYQELYRKGIILNEYEIAVGNPSKEFATRQLNELYQKRLINKPVSQYFEQHDEDGNSVWKCVLSIPGYKHLYKHYGYKKNDALRECAYEFLCNLMDYEYEEKE